MTAVATSLTGASSSFVTWDHIQWDTVKTEVRRLQIRIAKAISEGRHGKVKSLQWILTHSFHAKVLAVKRVVQNQGGKTPGVDKVIWKTPQQKMKAAQSLTRRGYQTQPLRRIYIPKKDGSQRPLSIPTMKCRAMQALHLLALDPVAEFCADKNSYVFRPKRSAADAIQAFHISIARKGSAQWILNPVLTESPMIGYGLTSRWIKRFWVNGYQLATWIRASFIKQNSVPLKVV